MTSFPLRLLSIILLFACPFTTDALADSTADIARDWGLLGTWAVDCSAPPVRGRGAIISYEITSDGSLIYRRDHDPSDINEVTSAHIEADETLVLSIVLPKAHQTRENGIAKTPDGSIRSVFNRGEDGSYTIRDGRFVANGKPTPLLRKCE